MIEIMRRPSKAEIATYYSCVDCRFDTRKGEIYFVSSQVWSEAGMSMDGGMLCLPCLARRLGRLIEWDDFKDNDGQGKFLLPDNRDPDRLALWAGATMPARARNAVTAALVLKREGGAARRIKSRA
jgi:hypothetical protein